MKLCVTGVVHHFSVCGIPFPNERKRRMTMSMRVMCQQLGLSGDSLYSCCATTEIYKKISFFRFRLCGDSGDHQDTRDRFIWLVRALGIPRGIVRLDLDSENESFEAGEPQDEEVHRCGAPGWSSRLAAPVRSEFPGAFTLYPADLHQLSVSRTLKSMYLRV